VAASADIYFCTPQEVPRIWGEIKGFLEEAVKNSRKVNLQGLYDNLLLGNYTLSLCILDGQIVAACVTTLIIDTEGDRACGLIALGGEVGQLYNWANKLLETVEEAARKAGCKYMFGTGRKGWERFGFEIIAYQMRREL
jgi:hypothetical protein